MFPAKGVARIQPVVPPMPQTKNQVLEIHSDMILKGELSMVKDVILTGKFEGELQTLGCLTVASGGVGGRYHRGRRACPGARQSRRGQGQGRRRRAGCKPREAPTEIVGGANGRRCKNSRSSPWAAHEKAEPGGGHVPPLPGDAERAGRRDLDELPRMRPVFQARPQKREERARPRAQGQPRGFLRQVRRAEPRRQRGAFDPVHPLLPLPRAGRQGRRGRADRQALRLRRRPFRRGLLLQGHGGDRPAHRGARQSLSASCARRRRSSRSPGAQVSGELHAPVVRIEPGAKVKVQTIECARLQVAGELEISGELEATEIILAGGSTFSGRLHNPEAKLQLEAGARIQAESASSPK